MPAPCERANLTEKTSVSRPRCGRCKRTPGKRQPRYCPYQRRCGGQNNSYFSDFRHFAYKNDGEPSLILQMPSGLSPPGVVKAARHSLTILTTPPHLYDEHPSVFNDQMCMPNALNIPSTTNPSKVMNMQELMTMPFIQALSLIVKGAVEEYLSENGLLAAITNAARMDRRNEPNRSIPRVRWISSTPTATPYPRGSSTRRRATERYRSRNSDPNCISVNPNCNSGRRTDWLTATPSATFPRQRHHRGKEVADEKGNRRKEKEYRQRFPH